MSTYGDLRKPPGDEYSPYETGLSVLLNRMGRDHPRYTEALVYTQRLTENITKSRRYGENETRRADRAKLIDHLNEFTVSVLGVYFTDLCGLELPPSEQAPPDGHRVPPKLQTKEIRRRLDRLCEILRQNRFNNPRRKPTVLILGSRLSIEGSMSAFGQIVANTTGYPEDFDGFYRKVGDISDLDERFRLFRCHLVGADEIPSGYRALAKLVKWNYFPLILTVNYDGLLERSLVEAGLGSGDFAVFSIGTAGLSEDYQDIVRWSLPTLDPPIKIIKINGDLATRNMAWNRDELRAIRGAYEAVLKRWLTGPVLLVASGPADESILWGLRDPGECKGNDYKSFWIIDSKRNLLDEDKRLRDAFNHRNRSPEVAANRLVIDPKYGEPGEFFTYLADRLVEDPAPVRRFNARDGLRKDGTRGDTCRDLWGNLELVDFLQEAKEGGACFTWEGLKGLTVPFWVIDQPKEWPRRGFGPDNFEFIEQPEDFAFKYDVFQDRYDALVKEDRARRGGEGCEWNESRIRFTRAERLADGRWQFHWQKVKYFAFRVTNLDLQRQIRAALRVGEYRGGGKLDPEVAQSTLENGDIPSFEWFRDFEHCWLGGAVGTGIIVIGKGGMGLVAQRDPGLKQDAHIYQLSGTGGVDPVEDRFLGKIDIFHSAYRETYYESGLKIPKEKFICVNWGIDLMIGHPLFNFIAYADDVDITTAAAKFRPERFEIERFRWVDLQDGEHVKEFLENVEVSSNNAVLIIRAHEWVKEHAAWFGK